MGFILSDLLESPLMSSHLMDELGLQAEFKALCAKIPPWLKDLKQALGKRDLAKCLHPLEASIHGLFPENTNAQPESTFFIPLEKGAAVPSSQLGLIAPYAVFFADQIWVPRTWPWTVFRESFFVAAGRPDYTERELGGLLASEEVGPVGDAVLAALMSKMSPALGLKFARAGVGKVTLPAFEADLARLLAPESCSVESRRKRL
jgi:hypothetical protein